MSAFSSQAPTVPDITQRNKSERTRDRTQCDISSVPFFENRNGCVIVLEAGQWSRFGWMVNLAVGLLEMNEGQFCGALCR